MKTKINNAANATANATKAIQNLQVIANGKDDQIATISKDDKLNFAAGNNLVATLDKDGKTVTYAMKDGVEFNNITAGKNGTNGTNGSITVNGKDGNSVTINGENGTIGAKGADGADGVVINGENHTIIAKGENGKDGVAINGKDGSITIDNGKNGADGANAKITVAKGADGVDGTNGADGITRIIYETPKKGGAQGVDKHEVATLDDGLKFGGNSGETYKKLNTKFDIKGAGTTWADFDQGKNIMTQVDFNGVMTIALAKALTGLTSAEFKNTAGDTTTVNGDGVSYNKADNFKPDGSVKDTTKTVSLGKDGISAGGNKITNIAAGTDKNDAVNKEQAETIAQAEAKKAIDPTFLKDKIEAGTNIAGIDVDSTSGKLKINAEGAKVEGTTGVVKVTSSPETGNITKYTVDLDDAMKTKINNAANATANATKAIQNLQVIANGKDDQIATISKDDKLNFAAGNNLVATLDKDGKTVTYAMKDGVEFNNITAGKNGTNGTNGSITVNGKDGNSVTINGENGTIGAKGADGADGVVINGENHTIIAKGENGKDGVAINGKDGSITIDNGKNGADGANAKITVAKGADGVDGTNGADGITRIIYETPKKGGAQGVDKHEVATLDDGLKFGGNSGETYKKLNTKFDIKGAGTTWADFDQGKNIMTQVDFNGVMTIALAKALKGLTSAEFVGGTDGGKTVINGDGVSYNKADNLNPDGSVKDTTKTVSLGKDGINAGGKTISNVGEAQNATDAVNMKQMNETIKTAIAKNNASTELTFVGDDGETKAKDGKITIAGGQTDTKKLSDKPNIGVVTKDGELDIKLAKDIEVDSVTAKDKITVGEGANKITIADGKITGITSAVDPNGDLAKKLADINSDTSKTDAEKAAKKKDAIKEALDSVVDNGSVATVGDLKNVTKGLDSVVTNVTNNVTNITNVVTGDNSNIINSINKAKDAKKTDSNYKDVVKDNPLKTYNPFGTTVKNNTTIVEAIKNINERGIKFIHVSDGSEVGKDDDVALNSNDSRANQIGSIGIGMKATSTAENAIATGTESTASGLNAIATGTKSEASGADSIAMGTGAQAMGKNTISIGTGNKVIGRNSGAIGDPSHIINVDGTYVVGNNNYIEGGDTTTVRDIFALGNNIGSGTKKVTDKANGSIILGSNGYSNVEHGVALGYGSNASVEKDKVGYDITNANHDNDTDGVWKSTESAVSVGNIDEKITRQITSVAAGTQDTDAVNVAQLRAVANQITAVTTNNGVTTSDQTFDPKIGKQVSYNSNYAPKVTNTGVNSVAIGANSVANRANTVSVGSAGNERIIANVADGVAPTDAANMRQLQSVANMVGEVKKDAMAGTASAMAIGNLPQATIPGKGMMAIGAGYYKGQTATALGVSKMSENGRWVFKASASYDSQRNVGAAGAIGFHF